MREHRGGRPTLIPSHSLKKGKYGKILEFLECFGLGGDGGNQSPSKGGAKQKGNGGAFASCLRTETLALFLEVKGASKNEGGITKKPRTFLEHNWRFKTSQKI